MAAIDPYKAQKKAREQMRYAYPNAPKSKSVREMILSKPAGWIMSVACIGAFFAIGFGAAGWDAGKMFGIGGEGETVAETAASSNGSIIDATVSSVTGIVKGAEIAGANGTPNMAVDGARAESTVSALNGSTFIEFGMPAEGEDAVIVTIDEDGKEAAIAEAIQNAGKSKADGCIMTLE